MRPLVLLTLALVRRLLREGLVLRSLTFPVGLTVGTLVLTLILLAFRQPPDEIAITGEAADPAFQAQLLEEGWVPVVTDDPQAMVKAGTAWAGTDGEQIWIDRASRDELRLEAYIRGPDARWAPDPPRSLPSTADAAYRGRGLARILGALFALYGVVFGAGMVARDRDDGTLEAELSLAVPLWIHGAARWLAGAGVLSAFFVFSVSLFDAFMGIPDVGALIRHGVAATGTAVAVGLIVIGRGGLKSGFSGPLSAGLSVTTALLGIGFVARDAAQWVPLASLASEGDGWLPLAGMGVAGLLAVAGFTWRAARG